MKLLLCAECGTMYTLKRPQQGSTHAMSNCPTCGESGGYYEKPNSSKVKITRTAVLFGVDDNNLRDAVLKQTREVRLYRIDVPGSTSDYLD